MRTLFSIVVLVSLLICGNASADEPYSLPLPVVIPKQSVPPAAPDRCILPIHSATDALKAEQESRARAIEEWHRQLPEVKAAASRESSGSVGHYIDPMPHAGRRSQPLEEVYHEDDTLKIYGETGERNQKLQRDRKPIKNVCLDGHRDGYDAEKCKEALAQIGEDSHGDVEDANEALETAAAAIATSLRLPMNVSRDGFQPVEEGITAEEAESLGFVVGGAPVGKVLILSVRAELVPAMFGFKLSVTFRGVSRDTKGGDQKTFVYQAPRGQSPF